MMWYAIHTNPKQEERAESNLEAWGIKTFNPRIRECRPNPFTGAPVYTSRPLFPRYIFAHFDLTTMLHKVRFTRGVHDVVSFGNTPIPVDAEVIRIIQSRIGEDGFVVIGDDLKAGDPVVIKDGPFKSLTGLFERKMKASDRVMVLLTVVNYQGRVEVERYLVEKVS